MYCYQLSVIHSLGLESFPYSIDDGDCPILINTLGKGKGDHLGENYCGRSELLLVLPVLHVVVVFGARSQDMALYQLLNSPKPVSSSLQHATSTDTRKHLFLLPDCDSSWNVIFSVYSGPGQYLSSLLKSWIFKWKPWGMMCIVMCGLTLTNQRLKIYFVVFLFKHKPGKMSHITGNLTFSVFAGKVYYLSKIRPSTLFL